MENHTVARQKAISLRKQGWSYREIRTEVAVSKSTLSSWLKGLPLKPEHKERLYTKQIAILSRGSQSQKARRQREVDAIIAAAKKEVRLPISHEVFRLMGVALYWAEGSKGKMLEITNSDPRLILFMVRWITSMFSILPTNLKMRLNIYPQQNETSIKKFWSDLTGIPISNFGKTFIKPRSKGFKKNNLYYGTARIEVPKSVDLHYRIFGWLQAALKNLDPEVAPTERKWQSLRNTVRPVNL
ncbi:helix-turn-helix domain-containing protein [Candidatus Parcubacteria bacterium]|nr:helix-turn-helix domain-containing protein [Candidatus Parcubacteria bacterium]